VVKYPYLKVIFLEKVADRKNARIREKYLKSTSGRKFLKKNVFKEK